MWQIPHFLAIDWFHRDDYESGGFHMVSKVDSSGRFGAYLTVIYSLALIPITLLATPLGLGGWLYFAGAIGLGVGLFGLLSRSFCLVAYLAWMHLVSPIGLVITHVLLAGIYYLIITPIGVAMRLLGRDPLKREIVP